MGSLDRASQCGPPQARPEWRICGPVVQGFRLRRYCAYAGASAHFRSQSTGHGLAAIEGSDRKLIGFGLQPVPAMTDSPNEAFVPLSVGPAAKPRREDFRVLVSERPETARPLRVLDPASTPDSPTHAPGNACEPQVTLHREGDSITGISIRCSCGQI